MGIVKGSIVAIYSSGQTIFSFTHIEDITLGTGEEVDEVAGGASAMDVDRIGEDSEGQAAGVYGTDFTVGSVTRIRARDQSWF